MYKPLVSAALILVAPSPFAQSKTVSATDWEAIIAQGKQHSEVMQRLDHLTNRIGPRLTSSDNLQNACEWARDYLKSIGYENARLEQWGQYAVGFNRGPWSGSIVSPKAAARPLEFVTRAWSAGTKGKQIGRAIAAPADLAAAKSLGKALAGTWLLRSASGRGFRRGLSQKALELNRYFVANGVLGVISAGRPARNAELGELLITSGRPPVNLKATPALPSITLRRSQFDTVKKLVDGGQTVELTFDIRNHFKQGPIPLYNVIADLEGSQKPDEYVVVGGHIDSWDGATGATDNGTGVATTLEAARILKAAGVRPRRTIRFMLWSGEEQGLQGSRAWVNKHRKLVHDKVSACLVHDGGTNYAAGIRGPKSMLPLLHRVFAGFDRIDQDYPFTVSEGGQISGSDHASFIPAGAPGFFWVQRGKANYTYTHHTQHDTYDTAIEPYQKQTAVVAALGAVSIANLDAMLPRVTRQEMMARGRRGRRGGLGFQVDARMVVQSVRPGGAAAASGLKKGDKLLKLGDTKLTDMRSLFMALRESQGNRTLTVERGGKEVRVKLGRRGRE